MANTELTRRSPLERLVLSITIDEATECWNWRGNIGINGYGYISLNGRKQLAHRFAWELGQGPIPGKAFVLHRCDNPRCVNPLHLFLGDAGDNARDMSIKERGALRKLTGKQVREIVAASGTYVEISERYGVGPDTIGLIKRGKVWKHITAGKAIQKNAPYFTPEQVTAIRGDNRRHAVIAREMGVNPSRISRLKSGENY